MGLKLLWMQCGGCGGDTWSAMSAESPDLREAFEALDVELLWHPSLSCVPPAALGELTDAIGRGEERLDVLCVEGAVIRGPGGTGMYDTVRGGPKKDLVSTLAARAEHVVAIGTCASFGGMGAGGEVEATGLQYTKDQPGGFLGAEYRSGSGRPVINLPGCPCHPEVIVGTLTTLAEGLPLDLTGYATPVDWYGVLVHQGCVRNEYHEYRVEERSFGEKGCMFFHLGCRGPLAHGPCNKLHWNRRSSKTSAGVPCFGCTQPDFPRAEPFFQSRNVAGVPLDLPEGVDRAHYLAYKSMAAAAAPERLRTRQTRV